MIHPNSSIDSISIEGSKDNLKSGEYIIDLAEYSSIPSTEDIQKSYYQLKHTTSKNNVPFNLSDLKTTIEGFAMR